MIDLEYVEKFWCNVLCGFISIKQATCFSGGLFSESEFLAGLASVAYSFEWLVLGSALAQCRSSEVNSLNEENTDVVVQPIFSLRHSSRSIPFPWWCCSDRYPLEIITQVLIASTPDPGYSIAVQSWRPFYGVTLQPWHSRSRNEASGSIAMIGSRRRLPRYAVSRPQDCQPGVRAATLGQSPGVCDVRLCFPTGSRS